jgi:hypothetical protein
MGGWGKTSTLAVTTKVPPSLYSRSRMGTALADSPKLSGAHPLGVFVIPMPCCSTSRDPEYSHPLPTGGYTARAIMDLHLIAVMITLS